MRHEQMRFRCFFQPRVAAKAGPVPWPLLVVLAASTLFALACGAGRERGTLIAIDGRSGEELWRVRPPMAAVSSPVIDEGLLFVRGGDSCKSLKKEMLVAYDAKTGEERWHADTRASEFCLGHLSVADGVAVVEDGGILRGLDARTGQELWTSALEVEREFVRPPGEASDSGVPDRHLADTCDLAFVSGFGTVQAFDRKSGVQCWESQLGELGAGGFSPIIVTATTVFFGLREPCGVVAIDLQTGDERWRQTSQPNGQCSAAAGERLAVDCFFNASKPPAATITAWDSDTGRELWKTSAASQCGDPGSPAVAVADSSVYVLGAGLQALEAGSGAQRWQVDTPGSSFVAANDEFVVVVDQRGRTAVAFDARSGVRLWETTLPASAGGGIGGGIVYLTAFGNPERPPGD